MIETWFDPLLDTVYGHENQSELCGSWVTKQETVKTPDILGHRVVESLCSPDLSPNQNRDLNSSPFSTHFSRCIGKSKCILITKMSYDVIRPIFFSFFTSLSPFKFILKIFATLCHIRSQTPVSKVSV